jgi:O-antigen biosynthesis protein
LSKAAKGDSFDKWIDLFDSEKVGTCSRKFDQAKELPLVTVVLVHHNRHKLLKQAIDSLYAQTYKNLEVILVDDGSTDPTSLDYLNEIAWKWWEERGWKVLREPNRYLGAARNTGAKQASGKYILFLDDDDYSKPHQIETMIRVAVNTGSEIVTAGHDVFSGSHRPTGRNSEKRYLPIGPDPLTGIMENVFGDSAMMVKKDFFIDFGGFTEDFGVGFEDYEFLVKAVLTGHSLQAIPESLHWYRHFGNTMSTKTSLKSNQLRMLRPYLENEAKFNSHMKALLDMTRRDFFKNFGSDFKGWSLYNPSNTTSIPTATPTPIPLSCQNYFDQSGSAAVQYQESHLWNNGTLVQ